MPNETGDAILHVDLTAGTLTVEHPTEAFLRTYLGGSAMGTYYVLRDVPAGTDGLDSANVLTFMLSPLTGAPIAGQSRMTVNARSPLVEGIGDSQVGGFFPAEMRFAGFLGIVLRGRAPRPVYLWLHDGEAELRPAEHLWGHTTAETEDLLRAELGDPKIEVAQIGPAGENRSRLAAIMNMANRANGRTGMGAVMGSKNLKAVVVRGTKRKVPVADMKRLAALAKLGPASIAGNPDMDSLARDGTASVVEYQHFTGTLPAYNYNAGQFAEFEAISGQTMSETILKERDSCFACAVRCKRVVETESAGRRIDPRFGGPEYETIGTMGSYCGVADLAAIALANQLCNEYGLDTIGTGATVAWAMECYEAGLLTDADTAGSARFGDARAMVRLVEMTARREGIGALLAEGSAHAARTLGKGADFLITAKGSEAPAHMPQSKRSLALIYAVHPFGADHQSSEHDPFIEPGTSELCLDRLRLLGFDEEIEPRSLGPAKVRYALRTQQFFSFLDTADLCQFVWGPAWELYGPAETVELVRSVTGWDDFTLDALMAIGERRLVMLRAFNAREGMTRAADRLPAKFFRPLTGTGPTAGVALDRAELEAAKDEYFRLAGWDHATGNPTPETLVRLGLAWIA